MTKQGDSRVSDRSGFVWEAVEAFIRTSNREGRLNSASRLFLALAMIQIAKRNGSCESELSFLTGLALEDVEGALEELDRANLLRISPPSYLIPTFTESRIYLPSNWARGKSVTRITGPRVASYALNLDKDFTLFTLEAKFKTSIEDLLLIVKNRVEEVDETVWQEYVMFAKIVLSDIRQCSIMVRRLYGDFLPQKVEHSISLLLQTFNDIERESETRQQALALLEGSIRILRESLVEIR